MQAATLRAEARRWRDLQSERDALAAERDVLKVHRRRRLVLALRAVCEPFLQPSCCVSLAPALGLCSSTGPFGPGHHGIACRAAAMQKPCKADCYCTM